MQPNTATPSTGVDPTVLRLLDEDLISFSAARRESILLKDGKSPDITLVYRWATRGAKSATGSKVRLEAVKTPRGWQTSRPAILRFVSRLTNPNNPLPQPRTKTRESEINAAERELQAAGMI